MSLSHYCIKEINWLLFLSHRILAIVLDHCMSLPTSEIHLSVHSHVHNEDYTIQVSCGTCKTERTYCIAFNQLLRCPCKVMTSLP